MIIVRNLRLGTEEGEQRLRTLAEKALRLPPDSVTELRIVKKSLDARKKQDIHWLYSVAVKVKGDEKRVLSHAKNASAAVYEPFVYEIPHAESAVRPVIAGFGPAGMFAALVLAEAGLRPIVLERGCDVETRRQKTERFWESGELDTECNVQFGEGGAGTFSDGKLNTGISDKRVSWVLERFCEFGAPENVRYDAKPHLGTDVLADIVRALREHVCSLGGEVRFNSKLTDIATENGALSGVCVRCGDKSYIQPCSELVLAVGHSARDTLEALHALGISMERKPFSMGVRIEHRQTQVDMAQYGRARESLPPADYKINCRLDDGESAYTFCMCPGGSVVAASSEDGGVVTNGMSLSARDGENANSALLVTLSPEDFPGEGVLAGMYWQREIERRAFAAGGGDYRAPAQTVCDFLTAAAEHTPGGVEPSYRPGVKWCDLRRVLPEKITGTLERAIPELGSRLKFFSDPEAIMTAPETRSSSPVRILRGDDGCASVPGMYPCGEGAGYAGGITSAAVDGMKAAERIIQLHKA